MSLVVPAVLPSSHKDLEEKLALLARIPSVNRVQIDVADGKFAKSISWPYNEPAIKSNLMLDKMLPYLDHFEYEIDLTCLDAETAANAWLALGATRLTFHAESTTDLSRFINRVRGKYGSGIAPIISFGLALNVASDLALIEPYLAGADYVQIMGIAQIGKQGQQFEPRVFEKVRVFCAKYPDIPLQVDGGVSLENAKKLVELGVSNLIIGSAIARAKNPEAVIAEFEALQTPYGV